MELKTKSAIHPPAKAGGLFASEDKINPPLNECYSF